MKYSCKIIIPMLFLICILRADPSLPKNCHLIELTSVGFPAAGCEHPAVRINDLQFFNGRLYIGYGDAVINTGPTDIIAFDLYDGTLKKEFTVDEEGIYMYKIVDSLLMIPGIDATDDWHYGNMYVLENNTWKKYRSIPHGIHVNDLESYNERLYASTGTFGNVGDSIECYFGALFASADTGKTWDLAYATPSDDQSIFRITALLAYNGILYAFPFAYMGMDTAAIPEEFHAGLTEEPFAEGKYLIILEDIFGTNDVITFNGIRWSYQDILPVKDLCYVSKPFIFKGTLILPTLTGQYVDYLQENKHLVVQAEQKLYAFDGSRISYVKLQYDRLLDVVVKGEYTFLLIQNNDLYYVVQTNDLKKWAYYVLPPVIDDPRSLEYVDNTFFIGTTSGNLFASQEIVPVKDYSEIEQCVPDKIYAEAKLPGDGHYYWITITECRDSTDFGRAGAEVKYGNIIKLTVENIMSLSILLPGYHMDLSHETTLIINDQVVYEGMTDNISELICTQTMQDSGCVWTVEPGTRTVP